MRCIRKEYQMAAVASLVYRVIEAFFIVVWGVTIIEIIPLITKDNIAELEMFNGIENTIKTITAILGLIYFGIKIIQGIQNIKKSKVEREIMKEDLRQKKKL